MSKKLQKSYRLRTNNKTQFVSDVSIYLIDKFDGLAVKWENKAKIDIRDEMEKQHIHDVYNSFNPIQMSGQKVQEYNEKHKHKQKQPYTHSGLLLQSIHGVIEDKVVKITIDDKHYTDTDKTSVRKVYEWLDKGTKENPKYDLYILGGKGSHTPYVTFWPQPKHGYKKATYDHMIRYIDNTIIPNIDLGKYTRKTRKGAK